MKHLLFTLSTALCLFLSTPLIAQEAKPEEPLPAGVVAQVDDVQIQLEAYKDFLWKRHGKRQLNQMIDHVLVKQAALDYGITLDKTALQQAFDARMEQNQKGRSLEDFRNSLREAGQTYEHFLDNLRADLAHEQLLDQLVLATRVPTDQRIQRAFDAKYGAGGVKVRIRHILVMPHFLRAEKIRAGAKPAEIDAQKMKGEARALADACSNELVGGADFSEMVAKYSHDQVSRQTQGELPSYRPGLYGPAFTAAVSEQSVGQNSAVLESGAGYHIVQVMERKITKLEDVRANLVDEVMAAVPTWQDREQVLAGLREAGEIKLW
jgi:parvulin-like peptidyl-prolyl isomerase